MEKDLYYFINRKKNTDQTNDDRLSSESESKIVVLNHKDVPEKLYNTNWKRYSDKVPEKDCPLFQLPGRVKSF